MGAYVYILRCADGRYYVGSTRTELERRVSEHNHALHDGFTAKRRPVVLAYAEHFDRITDAIACERQWKGWSRAKKQALIEGRLDRLPALASRPRKPSS
ncbi:putative endonuclease [Rhodoligotrophos appendicifer]|uniref:GIY-YIG nuclease family protein n=1 Tax=Rhodoligotrophos appendicifer TaxID=987056 RepID=UPI001184770E|nr:GIY-YIG nuclease family protein [Rhodoligotrophos appendicifer]